MRTRRKFWYYIGVAILLASAASARFDLPLYPLADPDTWGYLHPAIAKLGGGAFQHTNGRNFLYPGFLLVVLGATSNFTAITVVQHLLGLATGVLILRAWTKTKTLVRHVAPALHDLLGLVVAAVYLLSRSPVLTEHQLRPEAITPFFAVLNILLTLQFVGKRRSPVLSPQLLIVGASILLNSVLLATLKTSFALTILFSVIPVLIVLCHRPETWPRRAVVVLPALLLLVLVMSTERTLARSDFAAEAFLPESLFAIHANLIARQMDEDATQGKCGPYQCEWVREVSASLHEEMKKSWQLHQRYPSLGFDPDYLKYGDSLHRWRDRFFAGRANRQLDFYWYYLRRTLRMHPGRMLQKVMRQMALFYLQGNHGFVTSHAVNLGELYANSAASLRPHAASLPAYSPFHRYLDECDKVSASTEAISQGLIPRRLGGVLQRLYSPILFSTLAIALLLPPDLRRQYGALAKVTLFGFSYNFGNCLGTAIVHSLEVDRYTVAQYSFTVLGEFIGLLFLAEMTAEAYVRRCFNMVGGRPPHPQMPAPESLMDANAGQLVP